jgi:hypothetical protein
MYYLDLPSFTVGICSLHSVVSHDLLILHPQVAQHIIVILANVVVLLRLGIFQL